MRRLESFLQGSLPANGTTTSQPKLNPNPNPGLHFPWFSRWQLLICRIRQKNEEPIVKRRSEWRAGQDPKSGTGAGAHRENSDVLF